jgi:hypothetical protein
LQSAGFIEARCRCVQDAAARPIQR